MTEQQLADLRRKVRVARSRGIDVVATTHSWGWSRWLIGPSSVTRQAMYIKEPGLAGVRREAAAAIAHPDLIITLPYYPRLVVTSLTPMATVIASAVWAVAMYLGGGSWLPWILPPVLAILVMICCSRSVLAAVVGARLRIVDARSDHFDHLSSAADLLDGIDDSARRRLQIDTNDALWSAAGADSLRRDSAEKLACRAASLAAAVARADELVVGHEISAETWVSLTGPTLGQPSNSTHHERLDSIAEQLRLLDPTAAMESGIDADQILAEAASSEGAAERLDEALRQALQDTRTTHHVEGMVDQLVEYGPVSVLPIGGQASTQIEAYREEMSTRATTAAAAVAALHHADQRSSSELKENV